MGGSPKDLHVIIRTTLGRTYGISILDLERKAEELQLLIEEKEGIKRGDYLLIFNGDPLDDPKKAIKDYGIQNRSELYLIIGCH